MSFLLVSPVTSSQRVLETICDNSLLYGQLQIEVLSSVDELLGIDSHLFVDVSEQPALESISISSSIRETDLEPKILGKEYCNSSSGFTQKPTLGRGRPARDLLDPDVCYRSDLDHPPPYVPGLSIAVCGPCTCQTIVN